MHGDGPPWDIGIDWYAIIGRKAAGMLAAVPFLEEAGRLLYGAKILWPGRVRGGEVGQLGRRIFSMGGSLRRNAFGWQTGDHFLCTLMTEGSLHDPYRRQVAKDPQAAQILAWSGLQLAAQACRQITHADNVQQLDRGAYTKMVEDLEDRIEIASELSVCRPDRFPSQSALVLLHDSAIERLCEILCRISGDYCAMLEGLSRQVGEAAHYAWHERGRSHQNAADQLFQGFAQSLDDPALCAAILSGRPDESPASPGQLGRWEGVKAANRAAELVNALIVLLQGMRVNQQGLVPTK